MEYTFTLLSSKEDCDVLLNIAAKDKKELAYRKVTLEHKREQSSENSVEIESELQGVIVQVQAIAAVVSTLPEGDFKNEMISRHRKLEHKQFLLTERKNNYGSISLLETEYDIGCVEKSIAETDAFIDAINNRKASL